MNKDDLISASHYWYWIPAAILAVLTGVIYFTGSNTTVFYWVNGLSKYTGEHFWAMLTCLSDGVVSFVLLFPWLRRKPRVFWAIVLASIMFTIIVQPIKVVDVYRPAKVLDRDTFTVIGPAYKHDAFPSGHAAMMLAMAAVWGLHVRSWWVRLVLIFFGSLIAVSRIVCGVHWPLDTTVGAFLGWVSAWPAMKLARRWRWGYSVYALRLYGVALIVGSVILLFPYTKLYMILWEQRTFAVIMLLIGLNEYIKLWKDKPARA
jgi:membrane-associated phospholipid phosphatase